MLVSTLLSSLVLAQQADPQPTGGFTSMLPALVLISAFFYFIIFRPQKQKEQAHRDMVNSLKERDRVVTIGGIHGVVTNVQRDREEVTIRVDESNGTKLRLGISAIAQVIREENKNESS